MCSASSIRCTGGRGSRSRRSSSRSSPASRWSPWSSCWRSWRVSGRISPVDSPRTCRQECLYGKARACSGSLSWWSQRLKKDENVLIIVVCRWQMWIIIHQWSMLYLLCAPRSSRKCRRPPGTDRPNSRCPSSWNCPSNLVWLNCIDSTKLPNLKRNLLERFWKQNLRNSHEFTNSSSERTVRRFLVWSILIWLVMN